MATSRQVAANRANARKSTGPKTAAGKAVAAGNSTRHALLAADLAATQDEDAGALEALRADFTAELAPAGPLEAALCERVVSALWRLRRLQVAEVGLFNLDRAYLYEPDERTPDLAAARTLNGSRDTLAVLTRYEVTLERGLYAALHELQRLQAARAGEDVPAPAALDVNVHGLPESLG